MRILSILFLCSIASALYGTHYPHGSSLKHKIFADVSSKELLPTFQYGRFGYGGSSSKDYVRLISASFYYPKYASKEEMEDALIGTIERVLRAYNANKKIRPLLVEYPLTPEHVEVSIVARHANPDHPEVISWMSCVSHSPFRLFYNCWDPVQGKETTISKEESETYEEVKARREAARGRPFLED